MTDIGPVLPAPEPEPTPTPPPPAPPADLEMVALVARTVADKAVREILTASQKPATVLEFVDNVATVHVDGDPPEVTVQAESTVSPSPYPNARVFVQFHPPNAVFVSGWITRADPPGEIKCFAGDVAPAGFLACNGAAYSRAEYAALFEYIGTKYGAGDGSTTFNVPNYDGQYFVGSGALTVGTKVGAASVALTAAQLPGHDHDTPRHFHDITHHHDVGTHSHGYSTTAGSGGGHAHGMGSHSHSFGANTDNRGFHNHLITEVGGTGNTVHRHADRAGIAAEAPAEGYFAAADFGTLGGGGHTHGVGGTTSSVNPGDTGSVGGHGHSVSGTTSAADAGNTGTSSITRSFDGGGGPTSSVGSGQAHENRPPSVAVLVCISF